MLWLYIMLQGSFYSFQASLLERLTLKGLGSEVTPVTDSSVGITPSTSGPNLGREKYTFKSELSHCTCTAAPGRWRRETARSWPGSRPGTAACPRRKGWSARPSWPLWPPPPRSGTSQAWTPLRLPSEPLETTTTSVYLSKQKIKVTFQYFGKEGKDECVCRNYLTIHLKIF